ncbi:hypothetical protein [Mesobacillus thioparans]|uniref:hypothetical protein n=1 Tax=Mesobacillus thioparans TaxID=370439 RepID=UPI0039EF1A41
MNQLKVLLVKYLQVTNISIDPLDESIDLMDIFSEAVKRGYLSQDALERIQLELK